MSTLTFADTHNMVAFLEKPAESDGFHEIIDFQNANQIHYALTVNPIIYTSCIQQFWAMANVTPSFQRHVFINKQLGDISTHKKIFVNPFHTRNFANMKRAGKDFSGRITPLFDTMMVQASEEVGEDSDHPTDSTKIPIIDQPSTSSKTKKKQPSKKTQRQEAEVSQDETSMRKVYPHLSMIHNLVVDNMKLTDLMEQQLRPRIPRWEPGAILP
ncbi:hypothetical protein Tco_0786010 [Tanacetum coccineum]